MVGLNSLPTPPASPTKISGQNSLMESDSVPKLNLQDLESYHSILQPINELRCLKDPKNLPGVSDLHEFSSLLTALFNSLDSLPSCIRCRPDYSMMHASVAFSSQVFAAHLRRLSSMTSPDDIEEGIVASLEQLQITIASLERLLKLAVAQHAEKKPLPSLPAEEESKSTPTGIGSLQCRSSVTLVESPVVQEAEGQQQGTDAASTFRFPKFKQLGKFMASTDDLSTMDGHSETASSFRMKLEQITRRKLQHKPSSLNDQTSIQSIPTYDLRYSNIYFPQDPEDPSCDVHLPLPTGESLAVNVDSHGSMTGVSLAALIRILTSKEGQTIPDLLESFFFTFRFFTTPIDFVKLLHDCCVQRAPQPLDKAQQRVWNNNVIITRIRVSRLVMVWLEKFWRAPLDCEALKPLRVLIEEQLTTIICQSDLERIQDGLAVVSRKGYSSRPFWLKRHIDRLSNGRLIKHVPPTGFRFSKYPDDDVLQFHSEPGRKEFVRQLTLLAFDLFSKLNAEEFVRCSFLGIEDSAEVIHYKKIMDWTLSLNSFVSSTVLARSDYDDRRRIIEFWVDVAYECITEATARNYGCGEAILGGLRVCPIERMKKTLLHVDKTQKEKFREIDTFFASGFYTGYRKAVVELESDPAPYIPAMAYAVGTISRARESTGLHPTVPFRGDDGTRLLNWRQYRAVANTIHDLEMALLPYKYSANTRLQYWLSDQLSQCAGANAKTQKELDAVSILLEPRDPDLSQINTWLKVYDNGVICDLKTV